MRYVTFFTLLYVLVTFQFLTAQAPDTLWTRTYGGSTSEHGFCVRETSDGGYVIVADINLGGWNKDILLIKTNNLGDTLWTNTFGGDFFDGSMSVVETVDGGYALVGVTTSFGLGETNLYLIKTDVFGNMIWFKLYRKDTGFGYCIENTLDGGFIITGTVSDSTSNMSDIWLLKTDSFGDAIWTKTFGGDSIDIGNCVQITNDGGYIVSGHTESFGVAGRNVYLIKTDNNGDTLWTRILGSCSADGGKDVKQLTDDGYIIISDIYVAPSRIFKLIRTNSTGDIMWTKTYDGFHRGLGTCIQTTMDGGFVICGHTSSFGNGEDDFWLMRTNSSGDTLWTQAFGGALNDRSYYLQKTSDGGYIIVGQTLSFGSGGYDVLLIKTIADPMHIDKSRNYSSFKYNLSQNYPNPFNPSTIIEFDLPKSSQVTLKVFNILGEELVTLVSDRLSTGSYSYSWDASNLASGVYLYRLQAGDYIETRKMVLMR